MNEPRGDLYVRTSKTYVHFRVGSIYSEQC
jgi:hypothetical protein